MCMGKVDKKKPKPEGTGFKVFEKGWSGDLYGSISLAGPYPVGTWIKAKDYKVRDDALEWITWAKGYKTGFHNCCLCHKL